MFDSIKEYVIAFFKSRLFVLTAVIMILFGILLQRVFVLQIVNGEEYLNNYVLKIEKQRELKRLLLFFCAETAESLPAAYNSRSAPFHVVCVRV